MTTLDLQYLTKINTDLGINIQDQINRGLKLFPLATNCIETGLDFYKRIPKLQPVVIEAWNNMVQSALNNNIELYICSAFRDYEYQVNLIKRKLAQGMDINNIIKVLAPPGFSEHHTGCAIDIISSEMQELDESFEDTKAFEWLTQHAKEYNFFMTYPRDNIYGVIYEPWHWCYRII
jgi:D-alanyl-D-alanine carboxypeptidase